MTEQHLPVGPEVGVLDEPLCLRLGGRGATGAPVWLGVDGTARIELSALRQRWLASSPLIRCDTLRDSVAEKMHAWPSPAGS